MNRRLTIFSGAVVIFIAGAVVATRLETVHGQGQPGTGFAAVPGSKGGWDLTGPYDVVRDWPKPMSQLPIPPPPVSDPKFPPPEGIAVDSRGTIYAAAVEAKSVYKYMKN